MFKKVFKRIVVFIIVITSLLSVFSCAKKSEDNIASVSETEMTDVEKNIEYDVYKKIDFSEFVDKKIAGLNEGLIDYIDGGLYLSPAPCKITVKASVKIDKGPALPISDLNDGFAISLMIGRVYSYIYYADYGDDFFGKFHEIERASEYYYAGTKNIYFSSIGLSSLFGSPGWKVKNVYSDDNEYVGEFMTQDMLQTKVRVTIKDVYYKISKPTGIESEWDLNGDFEYFSGDGNQSFAMKSLDEGYEYILMPRFAFNINDKYDQRMNKFLEFFYITDDGTPVSAYRITNGLEGQISSKYKMIGTGISKNNIRTLDSKPQNVRLTWDKDSKTMIAIDNNGEIAATIKIYFIKEYKYKLPEENDTPGYRKYLSTTKN